MSSTDILTRIETMGDLPILPQTLLQIQRVATDDKSSADDLAQVILRDQVLAARILRMVNSAAFSTRGQDEIRSVQKAVIVLGFEPVRQFAVGLSVFDMMSKLSRSPALVDFNRHSIVTAAVAELLAGYCPQVPRHEAFVGGLLHDLGKVVLMDALPDAYARVLTDVQAGRDEIESERDHCGLSHDRAGRRLAIRWKLPRSLRSMISDHHDFDPVDPPGYMNPKLAVIVFANAIAHFLFEPDKRGEELSILQNAVDVLKINVDKIEDFYGFIGIHVGAVAKTLDLSLGDLREYTEIVQPNEATAELSDEEFAARTVALLELYRDIGAGIGSGRSSQDLMQQIVQGAVDILGFERVILFRVDRLNKELRPLLWVGRGAASIVDRLHLPLDPATGPIALAVLRRRSFHVPMARSETYADEMNEGLLEIFDTNGFVCCPVMVHEAAGAVLFADHGPGGRDVTAGLASELCGLADQIGVVLRAASPLHV